MKVQEYWIECISNSADECGLTLTPEQLKCLAEGVECGYRQYGLAFYSPPPSDRIHVMERENREKLDQLQKEYNRFRVDAETAVKRALRLSRDAVITIERDGEIIRL
jgi:hypothetical protein